MINSYTIRRARPEEAERLTEIAHAAKRYWNYPDLWIKAWHNDLTFTIDFIRANLVYAAVGADDTPVACYALAREGTDFELEHLWVEPSVIGFGLGRALFSHAVRTAQSYGGDTLFIVSDPNAEAFYQRMGAKRIGVVRADVCGEQRELPRMQFDLLLTKTTSVFEE